MEYNDTIMLAVFEKFLEDPESFFSGESRDISDIERCCPQHESHDFSLVRRHVIAFLSEFLLSPYLVGIYGKPGIIMRNTDYLNWSGQRLYEELKRRVQ